MIYRALFTALALAAALVLATGCTSNDNNETQRLVCSVASINSGGAVISAALHNNGTADDPLDDFVPFDTASVLFWARAGNSNMVIPEDRAYSAFIITSYDVTWRPGAAAPAELTNYNIVRAPLSLRVPIDDEAATSFTFAPLEMKSEPWYPDPLAGPVYTAALDLVFYGHEEGSEHEVAIPAGTTVTFIPMISE